MNAFENVRCAAARYHIDDIAFRQPSPFTKPDWDNALSPGGAGLSPFHPLVILLADQMEQHNNSELTGVFMKLVSDEKLRAQEIRERAGDIKLRPTNNAEPPIQTINRSISGIGCPHGKSKHIAEFKEQRYQAFTLSLCGD